MQGKAALQEKLIDGEVWVCAASINGVDVSREAYEHAQYVAPCMPCESPEERDNREKEERRNKELSDMFYGNAPWEREDPLIGPEAS